MGINLGQTSMKAVYFGQTAVKSVFIGSNQVWGGEEPVPPTPTNEWLCFTATQANSTVHLDKVGSPDAISLETSTNGSTWTDYSWTDSTGDTLTLANVGDKVYMRAKNENQTIGSSSSNYYKFVMTGQIAASGNIQTLMKADGSRTDAPSYCYYRMFRDCSSLTAAPELPATTLADYCYINMFRNCTSLTTAPKLLATTLASGCYQNMFNGCTSLSSMEVAFTDWNKYGAVVSQNWLQNVAATGTFTCPAELPDVRDVSHIPTGWTKVDAVQSLCFTAKQANSTVHLDKVGSPNAISLETSTDGSTWTDYSWTDGTGDTVALANVGDKVYFRAKTENQTIGSSGSNYYKFIMAGKIAASGNIQTLLKADGSRTDAPAYCYYGMFLGCTSLTTAPELPATTLVQSCYYEMFAGCTSLAAAPELPATILASSCYNYMFAGCTSLSSVKVAFTAWYYQGAMFTTNWLNNVAATGTFTCPSALPGTRDASHIPTDWHVSNLDAPLCFTAEEANTTVRLDKVGSVNAVSLETSTDGTNWTDYSWSSNTGDTITLSNIDDKVYFRAKNENSTFSRDGSNYYNFVGTGKFAASGNIQSLLKADCSRTDAPAYCYSSMFWGCTSLTTAPALPATTLADNCYYGMFLGCTSLTTAPELPATTLAAGCYNSMFQSCSSLASAPALPATTLAYSCYYYMFKNCSSLTTAPALPATTLAGSCYSSMFYKCTSLSAVDVSFTAWNPSNATTAWLNNVAATGTFTCPAELPDTRGTGNIPEGWTKVDAV